MLLTPDDFVNQNLLYCLGYSAQKYSIGLHAISALSNHGHLAVTDTNGDCLQEFTRDFFSLVARSMNLYRDRSENFWASGRPNCVMVAPFQDDIVDKLAYIALNPVEAELVSHVRKWPGVNVSVHQKGLTELVVERPSIFYSPEGSLPDRVALRFTLPKALDASPETLLRTLREEIERREARVREDVKSRNRNFLGARRVQQNSPDALPKSRLEKSEVEPTIACKKEQLRAAALRWKKAWQARYNELRQELIEQAKDSRSVIFPIGSYAVWKWYGFERKPWEGCFWKMLIAGMT